MSVVTCCASNDDRFRALARRISGDDWSRASLCERWTNHEVLAHLVVGLTCSAAVRRRCDAAVTAAAFDGANAAMARALAATRSPAELLDDFARLMQRTQGLGGYFPSRMMLGDHVTHELDMVFALDREPEIRADVLVAVLNTQVAAAESIRACVPRTPAVCACAPPTPTGARRARARVVRGPRRRARVGARQPAEGAGAARGDGVAVLASRAQPPDPYGRVRISR